MAAIPRNLQSYGEAELKDRMRIGLPGSRSCSSRSLWYFVRIWGLRLCDEFIRSFWHQSKVKAVPYGLFGQPGNEYGEMSLFDRA